MTRYMRDALLDIHTYDKKGHRYSRNWRVKSMEKLHDLNLVRYARTLDGFGDLVVLTTEGRTAAEELEEAGL